jgi:hypothetical protein
MVRTPEEIESLIRDIGAQIAGLGPALQGTVKKNRNRRVRKDGSVYVSPEHHTFVYRGADGNERWKRVSAGQLPAVTRMIKAGKACKRLAREHARLTTELAVASIGKKNVGR